MDLGLRVSLDSLNRKIWFSKLQPPKCPGCCWVLLANAAITNSSDILVCKVIFLTCLRERSFHMKKHALFCILPLFFCSFAFAKDSTPVSKEKSLSKYMKGIRKSTDKIEGRAWYHSMAFDISEPEQAVIQYASSKGWTVNVWTETGKNEGLLKYASGLYAYIGTKLDGSSPYLRFVIQYCGVDWMSLKSYKFVVDGKHTELTADDSKIKSKVTGHGVKQTIDLSASTENIQLLTQIAESRETIIRFYGRDSHGDHKVSKAEKKDLKRILVLYKAMTE